MSQPTQTTSKTERNAHNGADSDRGAQQAARHEGGDSQQREKRNTIFDGDEHSDAPGPFGTG